MTLFKMNVSCWINYHKIALPTCVRRHPSNNVQIPILNLTQYLPRAFPCCRPTVHHYELGEGVQKLCSTHPDRALPRRSGKWTFSNGLEYVICTVFV